MITVMQFVWLGIGCLYIFQNGDYSAGIGCFCLAHIWRLEGRLTNKRPEVAE